MAQEPRSSTYDVGDLVRLHHKHPRYHRREGTITAKIGGGVYELELSARQRPGRGGRTITDPAETKRFKLGSLILLTRPQPPAATSTQATLFSQPPITTTTMAEQPRNPANPAAYPSPAVPHHKPAEPGMSLRDYFAGHALQALLTGQMMDGNRLLHQADTAATAYQYADWMLTERQK